MRRNWFRDHVIGYLTIVVVLGLWELLIDTGVLDFQFLPAPHEVWTGLSGLISSGELADNLLHTLGAVALGWVIALCAGIVAGTVLGLLQPVWRYSMASLDAIRALPIVALVPLAVLLFGFTTTTEVVIGSYAAFWPIMLNTRAGIRGVSPELLSVAEVLRLGRFETVWKMLLPAATPLILVGVRLGLSTCLVLTLVAEMVGSPTGMGYAMIQQEQALQSDRMFAYLIVIGVLGVVLNAILQAAAGRVFRRNLAAVGEGV